jgi:hypothetical protein
VQSFFEADPVPLEEAADRALARHQSKPSQIRRSSSCKVKMRLLIVVTTMQNKRRGRTRRDEKLMSFSELRQHPGRFDRKTCRSQ